MQIAIRVSKNRKGILGFPVTLALLYGLFVILANW